MTKTNLLSMVGTKFIRPAMLQAPNHLFNLVQGYLFSITDSNTCNAAHYTISFPVCLKRFIINGP